MYSAAGELGYHSETVIPLKSCKIFFKKRGNSNIQSVSRYLHRQSIIDWLIIDHCKLRVTTYLYYTITITLQIKYWFTYKCQTYKLQKLLLSYSEFYYFARPIKTISILSNYNIPISFWIYFVVVDYCIDVCR